MQVSLLYCHIRCLPLQMSDVVTVAAVEQTMSEMLFHIENTLARESSPIEPM